VRDNRPTFLVCYDYGAGGIWGLVQARSKEEVVDLYPELDVITPGALPEWMTENWYRHEYAKHLGQEHDIKGAPWGLLSAVLDARREDESRRGPDRRAFLVGIGDARSGEGAWVFVRARSEIEIRNRYPNLTVVHGKPDWAAQAAETRIANEAIELDAIPGVLPVEQNGPPPIS